MTSILAPQAQSPNREIDSLKLQLAAELAPARWKNALKRFSKHIHAGEIWNDSVNRAKPAHDLKNVLLAVCVGHFQRIRKRLNEHSRSRLAIAGRKDYGKKFIVPPRRLSVTITCR